MGIISNILGPSIDNPEKNKKKNLQYLRIQDCSKHQDKEALKKAEGKKSHLQNNNYNNNKKYEH